MVRTYFLFLAALIGVFFSRASLYAMEEEFSSPEGRGSRGSVQSKPIELGKSALEMLDNLKAKLDKEFEGYERNKLGQDAYLSLPSCIRSFTGLLLKGVYTDPYNRLPDGYKKKSLKSQVASKNYGIRRKKANEQEKTKILSYIAYLAQKAHQYPELEKHILNEEEGFGYMTKTTFVTGKGYDYITVHGYLVCMAYGFMKEALKKVNLPDIDFYSVQTKNALADAIPRELIEGYVKHFGDGLYNFKKDYAAISEGRQEHFQLRDRISNYFSAFESGSGKPFGLAGFLKRYNPKVIMASVQSGKSQSGGSSSGYSYFEASNSSYSSAGGYGGGDYQFGGDGMKEGFDMYDQPDPTAETNR